MLPTLSDNRKIGIGLTAIGVFFLFLGIILLFDTVLLAFGNFMFVIGTTLMIGTSKTIKFFFRKEKLRGTTCFIGGMIMVLLGWSIIGILIEGFGIINLFGNFFPIILAFLKRMPIIGPFLSSKYMKKILGDEEGLPLYSNKGN